MVPQRDSPDTVEPPFTIWSGEHLLIAVPAGIVMLIVGGALRVDIAAFKIFLLVGLGAGIGSGAALSQRTLLEKLGSTQRTILEFVVLAGMASSVCFALLKIFLDGRT